MNIKKLIPCLVAVILFATITILSFLPLLSGKALVQGDIIRYRGMSQEVADFRKAEHAEPLWTNSMFGGMPAYQVSTTYPGNWLGGIDKLFHLGLPHPSGYIFLCFIGFFILLLCLDVDPWLALVGSLAYGFSSYFFIIIEAGHNSKANAIGYMAPLLGGIILLLKGRYWLGFVVTALFMALELNANHVQISYYAFILFGIIFVAYLVDAISNKTLKPYFIAVAVFLAASVIGLLPNAGNLLATNEYGKYTTRGASELTIDASGSSNAHNKTSGLDRNYATQWSYGVGETFTFLIPNFKGGASSAIGNVDKDALKKVEPQLREQIAGGSAYFGDQPFTSGPVYIGAIVMLLALLGLFIIDNKLKWPLVIATVLTVMLAWGHNFKPLTNFFMDYVPGYNKFRAVAMILVIAELTIPLLAVLALDKFVKSASSPAQKIRLKVFRKEIDLRTALVMSVAVVGTFCLVASFVPTAVTSFTSANEEAQVLDQFKKGGASDQQIAEFMPTYLHNLEMARESIFTSDARRSLIFVGLAAVFLFLYMNKKLNAGLFYAAMAVFLAADLWPVAYRYLNAKNFEPKAQYNAPPAKTMADEQILADKALDYRVLNLSVSPWNDASTSYYHKSVGGYHGAKLKKYQEIIDFHLDKEINRFYQGINKTAGNDSLLNALYSRLGVLNMLNTRYLILPMGEGQLVPLKNPQANGNAWFVKSVKDVPDANAEIMALDMLNTKTEAVVQQKNKEGLSVKPAYSGEGHITLTSYKPNHLVYETESPSEQFAVFSEIYYPKGWNAYVDGALQPHTNVDYILRGMPVAAGKHKIEFKFEPAIYKTGNSIALFGSVLLILSVIGGLFMYYKKNRSALAVGLNR